MSMGGMKTPIPAMGGSGGGGALVQYSWNHGFSDASTSSTSYVNTPMAKTMPNDGKKYLVVFNAEFINESGVSNQEWARLYDGTNELDVVQWYGNALVTTQRILTAVVTGNGQTITLQEKCSNNSMRFVGNSIYGASGIKVYTIQ